MSTKHFADGAAHSMFSPYETPYQAFTNYMNVLADFIVRVEEQYPLSIENEELNSLLTTIRNQATEIEALNKELGWFYHICARRKKKYVPQHGGAAARGSVCRVCYQAFFAVFLVVVVFFAAGFFAFSRPRPSAHTATLPPRPARASTPHANTPTYDTRIHNHRSPDGHGGVQHIAAKHGLRHRNGADTQPAHAAHRFLHHSGGGGTGFADNNTDGRHFLCLRSRKSP